MDHVQDDLEKHIQMSTGNNNTYPTTVSLATAHILIYETAKQRKAQ